MSSGGSRRKNEGVSNGGQYRAMMMNDGYQILPSIVLSLLVAEDGDANLAAEGEACIVQ